MGHVIAVSGKGGVGKTTLCGLLIQYLCESGKRPVLAVDADANANLNEVLGVEPEITLGELREEIERAGQRGHHQAQQQQCHRLHGIRGLFPLQGGLLHQLQGVLRHL